PSGHYLHCLTRPFVALAALLTSFSPSSSFSAPPAPALYSLSLHDALPIYAAPGRPARRRGARRAAQLPDPVRLGRRPTAAARRTECAGVGQAAPAPRRAGAVGVDRRSGQRGDPAGRRR